MMADFLTMLAGARKEILVQCPTERLKFQSLGWAILITSGIATVSMWFALASVLGINPVLAFPIAILWGVVIMGIDRWLVVSIPPNRPGDGLRRLGVALPRVILALLIGSLISTPIVLRIFQSEINTQIAVIKQERLSTFLTQQQHSVVSRQVTYWTNQVANLQKVTNSGGQVPLNPSADPDIQSLEKQRTAELALEQQYYQQWQCELYGGPTCKPGNGPLAQASEQSYLQAKQQVSNIDNQITAREQVLSATDVNSEHTRYQEAENALPNAQQQLASAAAQENTLRSNFEADNLATNGLLIRLQALNELSGKDFTVNATRILLFLLFLVIECLPVTVKLLQRPGNYEEILQTTAERELKDAKRAIRFRRDPNAPQDSWVPPAPQDSAAAPAGGDDRRDLVREVWTSVTPAPDWPSTAVTEPLVDRPDEPVSSSRVDAGLRGMREPRRPTIPDLHGATELRYDDDEL